MKKITSITLSLFMLISLVACDEQDTKTQHIGIIQYAQHPALDQSRDGFIDALKDEGFVDGENISIDEQNAQGEGSNAETIADKLVNDNNDLIYAIATPSAIAVSQKTQEIPIVVSAVTNPADSGLVKSNEKPDTNITGVSDLSPVDAQIDLLLELAPNVKSVAIMYTNAERNSELQYKIAKKALEKKGIEVKAATVSDTNQVQQVAESLVGKVDALYVPTDNMVSEAVANVVSITNENNIPSVVGEIAMVEKGALATYGINYYNLGYIAGKQAAKILRGEAKPQDMAIEYASKDDLEYGFNTTSAKKLGITIPDALLKNANIIE
ncbi:MAG: ABC transporter substrate-binding protein [Breznakia sp.]